MKRKWRTIRLKEPVELKKGDYGLAEDRGKLVVEPKGTSGRERKKLLELLRSSPVRTH